MIQRVNSTPTFIGLKLIPLFLLAPWLGMSVLDAPLWAQTLSPSDSSLDPIQSPPTVTTTAEPAPAAVPKTATRAVTSTPSPTTATTSRASSEDASNAYIDRTDYSIGATQPKRAPATAGYSRPSAVVLSERTTGQQTVLRAGQNVAGSLSSSGQTDLVRPVSPQLTARVVTAQTGASLGRTLRSAASPTKAGFSGTITATAPAKVVSHSLSSLGLRLVPSRTPKSLKPGRWLPGDGYLTFPLAVPAAITSAFGWRVHPITGEERFHAGTDLGAPMGTPVLAADAGKVAIADLLGGYGLSIVLEHNQGKQATRYAHLSEVLVQPGTWVEQGSVIGRVGSTGNSTGPHLHFEMLQATPQGWVVVDPGAQLESALAHLVRALQTAQAKPETGT